MSQPFQYKRLDKDDAACLLVDHQSGLISLVQDFSPGEFKNSVLALANVAKFFDLPTILTTSFEDGPNGPIVPELKQMFPDAPYLARPGQINAWDNDDFVKAVEQTGRKQLIIAGVVTDVCVTFPALSAIEAGYDVFVVTDASGTFNPTVPLRRPAMPPLVQPDRAAGRVVAHGAGGRATDELVQRRLRTAPRLAQRHRGTRQSAVGAHPRLPQPDHELPGEVEVRGWQAS